MAAAKPMRAPLIVLAILAPLVAVLPSSAEGGLLQDATGDARLNVDVAGMPVPAQEPGGSELAAMADIVSLDMAETDDALRFVVAVASLSGEGAASHRVWFSTPSADFVLSMSFSHVPGGSQASFSALYRVTDDEWERVATLTPEVDVGKGTLAASFPKVYLVSDKGAVPGRGDALSGIRVTSMSLSSNFFLTWARIEDKMPDDDAGAADVTLQLGDYSSGNLQLLSPERVRVSNGGSTTFVFMATLRNLAESESELDLVLQDVPEGWEASVQSPVRVPGGGERTVAILASVPFEHDHGGYDSFNLTVQGKNDPGTQGRMRFGVLHTPIPQPAGHHPDLYLHSMPRVSNPINDVFNHIEPFGRGSMNTDSSHADDEAFASQNYGDDEGRGWLIPLSPGLQMGLDFDLEKTATLHGTIMNAPPGDVELRAELRLVSFDKDPVTLAESEKTPVSFELNAPTTFDLVLAPTEDADYVPHAPQQNLQLILRVVDPSDVRLQSSLRLMTEDFKLTLPLNEYHDKLTGETEAASVLDLKADGPVEKAGRPGTIVTYLFTLENSGSAEESVEVDLAGADSRVATLIPSGALTLGPKEKRSLTVGVSIPSDASDGEELEVLVFAHGVDDPSKTAIARTKTRVSLGSDAVADESPVLIAARDAENDTPGPGALLVAFALLGAALLARRPRRPTEASSQP